jgi:hypothetical protein
VELTKYKPEMIQRMLETLNLQPPKIATAITTFSQEFEKTFGITRP